MTQIAQITYIIWLLRRIGAIGVICGLITGPSLLGSVAGASAPSGMPAHWATWRFEEGFRNGISDWISYPLAQDEGYDPSIYTTSVDGTPALVRDVTAYGQKVLRVGLLHPLQFYAGPSSTFDLSYSLQACGPVVSAQIILAAASGEKYLAKIPSSPGVHTVELTGQKFGLRAGGGLIQAIIVEAKIASPLLGSHNRLTLLSFSMKAERPPSMSLEQPTLVISPGCGMTVANHVVASHSPLLISWLGRPHEASLRIEDGAGKLIHQERIQEKNDQGKAEFTPPENDPGLWSARVESNAGAREFRFLVLGKVPPHPRILLTAERVAQLKTQAGSNVLLRIVHERAAELSSSLAYNPRAGESIALLSPASVFPGLPEYFQLMEAYSNTIAFNALDYRLSGSSQSLATARKALLTVAQWPTWTPPWFLVHGLHTYYEVGVFTQRVAFGYDLIADELSPAEKSRIAEAFWKNSILPTLQDYFFNNRLPTGSSNHMANSVGGAIAACTALYGDVPDWNSRFAPALAELTASYETLLQGLFPSDESEAEPAGYEDFAMEGMSFGAAALQSLGIHPRGMERMLQSFWWLRYARFAPGKFLDTGDFDGDLSSLSGYAWSAENAGDPALESFYESAKNGTLIGLMGVFHLAHTGRRLEEAPTLLDLSCCTQPVVSVPAPPLARIFPLRGSAVMRSGWAPNSTVISLRAGPWFNHEHHDQGSFQVAAWGEDLIAEAGYADYYKDPRYADYFSQAPGHNTVLVDSDPFSQEDYDGRYWPALDRHPKFLSHVFSPALDFLSVDLTPAYNDGEKLDEYVREYVFIKPDVLIVHDRLRAHLAHHYAFLLHAPPGDPVYLRGSEAVIQGKAAFAAVTSRGLSWTLHRAPVPENAYTDLDRNNVLSREALRLDSPLAPTADFAVAIRFQKVSENPAPFAAFKTVSGFGYKSSDSKSVVLFRTSPGMLVSRYAPVGEVSSDGNAVAITRHNGVKDVLAVEASELRLAGRLLFAAKPSKVDIILHEDASGELVRLDCVKETNLQVYASHNPVAVSLDGTSIPSRASNGFVSISRLAQGEHVVRIRY